MIQDKSFFHLFKTPGGYYLYDVNTNSILNVKKSVYDSLKESNANTNVIMRMDNDICEIKGMKERGFLSEKRIKVVSHSATETLKYHLNNKLKLLILQVTQQCNLRCGYCVYSGNYFNRGHSNKRMDFDTAKKGIDFLIHNSRDTDSIGIGFYGGEPLLEFDLMKKCINYALSAAEGKDVTFNFTTNGTLLSKEIIEFLSLYNINIIISLDGPVEIHDKNRKFASNGCGTFNTINQNLQMIKKDYPEFLNKILFNIVLDKESDFSCINQFFTDYETIKDSMLMVSELAAHYAKSTNKSSEEYNVKIGYEKFKLLLSKVNRLDKELVSKLIESHYDVVKKISLGERNINQELPDKAHHSGPCIPGAQRLFIDVDGKFYPCEKVSELSKNMCIGHIDRGFDIERVEKLLNIGQITSEECKNCWALRFCTICATVIDDTNQLSADTKRSLCKRVREVQEEYFKDYCTLIEFGHSFDDNNSYYVMEG